MRVGVFLTVVLGGKARKKLLSISPNPVFRPLKSKRRLSGTACRSGCIMADESKVQALWIWQRNITWRLTHSVVMAMRASPEEIADKFHSDFEKTVLLAENGRGKDYYLLRLSW